MSETIHIKLPDGSDKEVPKGTTALDVAKSISPRLADAAIAAKARPLGRFLGRQRAHDSAAAVLGLSQNQTGETPVSPQSVSLQALGNGDLIDLTRPLEKDTDLRILTEEDPEALG